MDETLTLAQLMKKHEHDFRRALPKEDYLLLRLDGKAFHSYTKGLAKPYDSLLMDAMDETLLELCEEIQGVRFGYVESDEISLVLSAFSEARPKDSNPTGEIVSELWMGGVEAKVLSLSASIATAAFNDIRREQALENGLSREETKIHHRGRAHFDARLWTFPGTEAGLELVQKYFAWRRRDSIKNSVTMAALAEFSHKELHKLKTEQKQEMLREKGMPWEELPDRFRFGAAASRVTSLEPVTYVDKRTQEVCTTEALRSKWELAPAEDLWAFWDKKVIPLRKAAV